MAWSEKGPPTPPANALVSEGAGECGRLCAAGAGVRAGVRVGPGVCQPPGVSAAGEPKVSSVWGRWLQVYFLEGFQGGGRAFMHWGGECDLHTK